MFQQYLLMFHERNVPARYISRARYVREYRRELWSRRQLAGVDFLVPRSAKDNWSVWQIVLVCKVLFIVAEVNENLAVKTHPFHQVIAMKVWPETQFLVEMK